MSSALAYAEPLRRPSSSVPLREVPQDPRRVQIVTTRAQRRRRPKLAYAITAVVSVFGIFMAQLLLSIALSGGAYQLSSGAAKLNDLGRTESSLNERLQLLASPQQLALEARSLGMGPAADSAFIRLSNGKVSGTPTAAGKFTPVHSKTASAGVVPNSLLKDLPVVAGVSSSTADAASTTGTSTATSKNTVKKSNSATGNEDNASFTTGSTGAATADSAGTDVTSDSTNAGALPSPVTH